MSIQERKARDASRMRERIFKAALDLFAKGGYPAVTMRAIAQAIEYSPGTIYRYFRDKNEILRELCFRGFEMLLAIQAELSDLADPLERLRQAGRRYISFARQHPDLYAIMFTIGGLMKKDPGAVEDRPPLTAYHNLESAVAACLDARGWPAAEVPRVALALWSQWHGLAMLLVKDQLAGPIEPLQACVHQAADLTLAALSGDPGHRVSPLAGPLSAALLPPERS
jgi:AcrR family transcriptional regulator